MRTFRTAVLLLVVAALALGSSVAAVAATEKSESPISEVTGSLEVDRLPGGTFAVQDRVFQYRDFPVSGSTWRLSDPRLSGYVLSDWSWDVDALGDAPKPAWGTIEIAAGEGTWEGTFTGIQHGDFDTVGVRAFLLGTGPFAGLCATLDITSTGMSGPATWLVDGVVHPVPMAG